jgi:hypothetical protein
MKLALHDLSEAEKNKALDGLTIPVGEFGVMLTAALMTLALLFAHAPARSVVATTVATASSAIQQIVTIGSRMTARAAEQNAASQTGVAR